MLLSSSDPAAAKDSLLQSLPCEEIAEICCGEKEGRDRDCGRGSISSIFPLRGLERLSVAGKFTAATKDDEVEEVIEWTSWTSTAFFKKQDCNIVIVLDKHLISHLPQHCLLHVKSSSVCVRRLLPY